MNGGVSPLSVVLLIRRTEQIATIMPNRYIEYVIRSAFMPGFHCEIIAPATAVSMGSFAPHEKNGITLIVAVRSFSSANVRVLIIAGTEQPNPIIMGRNALPDSPNFLNILSRINAIRVIYPESSSMEKHRKSTRNKNKDYSKGYLVRGNSYEKSI